MMCGLYKEGGAVKPMEKLVITAVVVVFCLLLYPIFGQQEPVTPLIGQPTSMRKAESDFSKKLDQLLELHLAAKVKQGEVAATLEDHTERLDRIEANTQPTKPEVVEPPDEPQVQSDENLTIVRLYTADSSWRCLACEQQKAKLAANAPAFEYKIIYGPSGGKSPTGRYPAWELIRPDGKREIKSGQLATSTLNAWVNGNSQGSTQTGRYSIAELRKWIRQNYDQTSLLMADVKPRSSVWSHLQDHNHGFTPQQVTGLAHWEAMALHDAHHQERITPFRGSAKAVRLPRRRVIERPHYAYWSGA